MEDQKRSWLDNAKTFGCLVILLLIVFAVPIAVILSFFFERDKGLAKVGAAFFLIFVGFAGTQLLMGKLYVNGEKMEGREHSWPQTIRKIVFAGLTPMVVIFPLIQHSPYRLNLNWIIKMLLWSSTIGGLCFLLKTGVEKFRVNKYEFEGEWHTLPRSLKEQCEIIMPTFGLFFVGLLVASYFEVEGAGRAAMILITGIMIGLVAVPLIGVLLDRVININWDDFDGKDDGSFNLVCTVYFALIILVAAAYLILSWIYPEINDYYLTRDR